MSITRRGNSWLVSVSYQGNRIRRCFRSHDEARKFEPKALSSLMEGKEIRDSKTKRGSGTATTFGEIADRIWELEWKNQKAADHTFNRMVMVCSHFGDGTPVQDIGVTDLEEYIIHLREIGNSPATINRKMAIVKKVLRYAYNNQIISLLPKVPSQREPKGRIKYYTKTEEDEILDLMDDHDLRDLFAVLLDTGFRRGEALSIEWEDVRFDQNLIRLADPDSNKASVTRTVPMTRRVQEIMTLRLGFDLDRPFPYTSPEVDTLLSRFRKETGYKGKSDALLHTCRHTFCSRLVQRGVPIVAVKELAGHKDINTTLRYSHLAPSNFTDAIAKLEPE